MSTQLVANTDLTFVPRQRTPRSRRRASASRVRETSGGTLVELGPRWRPGDATILLNAVRKASRVGATLTLTHSGAGGMSLLRAAVAESPTLRVQEWTHSAAGLCEVHDPQWRRYPLRSPVEHDGSAGAVAITGGLGGLGMSLATRFALGGHAVWLIDRRPVSELPAAARLQLAEIAALTRVAVSCSDVTCEVPDPPFDIKFLVYAAGDLERTPVNELSADGLERGAARKATGLRRCVTALARTGLRAVVAFGSVESRRPHRLFGEYALTNELMRLEAARLRRRYTHLRLVTAEWSLWADVGMAADSASLAEQFGFAVVSPDWGAEATQSLLTLDVPPDEIVLGGSQSSADRPVRVIAGVGGSSHSLHAPMVNRLVTLCRPHPDSKRRHQPHPGSVLRAIVGGNRVGTWATGPTTWELRPDGGQ